MRRLLELLSRNLVLKRRLPDAHGGAEILVSPDASLRFWRRDLERVDPWLLAMAKRLVRPGSVVWDVGANVGLFAFAAAFGAGPRGRVVALEADPWLASLLRRSAVALPASYAPVEVLPAAAASSSGTVELVIARRGRAANHLASVAGSSQSGGPRETLAVDAVSLDSLLSIRTAPTVVKIDVEGAELEVLAGAERVLSQARPTLLIEVSSPSIEPLSALLTGHRYTMLDAARLGDPDAKPVARAVENTVALPGEVVAW